MMPYHADVLLRYLPAEKVCVLGGGIPDPFGGTEEDYQNCAAAIYAALEQWIEQEWEDKT